MSTFRSVKEFKEECSSKKSRSKIVLVCLLYSSLMFDINREKTTQRFGLSGINFNEIVGRIRSLDGLYTSTIQKVEFWSGKEFTFAAKIAARKWSVYRALKRFLVPPSFWNMYYFGSSLLLSCRCIWRKKALESSKPFVFFPCRFLSSAATTFLFNFRLLLKHFQFTSNENQE